MVPPRGDGWRHQPVDGGPDAADYGAGVALADGAADAEAEGAGVGVGAGLAVGTGVWSGPFPAG